MKEITTLEKSIRGISVFGISMVLLIIGFALYLTTENIIGIIILIISMIGAFIGIYLSYDPIIKYLKED